MGIISKWEKELSQPWRAPVPYRQILKQAIVQFVRTIRKGR
jgi:hypothetical protein